MTTKNQWLRGVGMGLMGFEKAYNNNRKMQVEERKLELEQMRQENLHNISKGRLGVDREYLDLQEDRESNRLMSENSKAENKAIESVQARIDAVRDPDDYALDEYITNRAIATKANVENAGTADELQATLSQLEADYRTRRLEGLTPGTEAYKARQDSLDGYVKDVHNIIKTGNSNMKRAFGDKFTGDITDYLYLSGAAGETFGAGLGEVVPGGERVVEPPSGDTFEGRSDESAWYDPRGWFGGVEGAAPSGPSRAEAARARRPALPPASGSTEPTGLMALMPEISRWYNEGNVDRGRVDAPAPDGRRLQFDPETGRMLMPGPGSP